MNGFENALLKMRKTCDNMYRLGWDERNGGNISLILEDSDCECFRDVRDGAVRETKFDAKELAGKYILVTGTGKYFKNVYDDPETNLGVIRISDDGKTYMTVWGFSDNGAPTSELPTHLMNHIERLRRDPNHRVVLHTHPLNIIAMTFVVPLDDKTFTRILWSMITECVVVFPDGVGVLEWMLCGGTEIGVATSEKMKTCRCAVWAHHGIFGAGTSLDEAFGLVETVEKAAEIYMKIGERKILSRITDEQLLSVAKAFKLDIRREFIS